MELVRDVKSLFNVTNCDVIVEKNKKQIRHIKVLYLVETGVFPLDSAASRNLSTTEGGPEMPFKSGESLIRVSGSLFGVSGFSSSIPSSSESVQLAVRDARPAIFRTVQDLFGTRLSLKLKIKQRKFDQKLFVLEFARFVETGKPRYRKFKVLGFDVGGLSITLSIGVKCSL